ncbi:nucleoside 2-deoxyribosyltransferase domain-containing protein [Catelliglobosispora koreensis]|uniref:nucleoside 2-deoxyribosyltransferase domain-containing protein n=1 Tax=Catelliglobosispora koreensis TaxID=129052 RepID=UPI0003825BF2|nr:nucleoside 2-deoxyribosyltransferase domain-containing protein [Catelliglobosispora koreensis]
MVTDGVVVIHAGEQPPIDAWHASIFLAGPNPRDQGVPSWRPDAVDMLRQAWANRGTLAVFVPEGRGWKPLKYERHPWESKWLSTVDVIAFWVQRDMATMPALNTNIEFGRWEDSGRIVFGAPPESVHVGYMRERAHRNGAPVTDTLDATMLAALAKVGAGAYREHGERDVPLNVWRSDAFTSWLSRQRTAGRNLNGGYVLLARGPGPDYWAFNAQVDGQSVVVVSDSLSTRKV